MSITINDRMTVAEILEQIPDAAALFQRHGVDPIHHCGPRTEYTRLYVTPSTCWLERVDRLLVELRAAAERGASLDGDRPE